MLGVLAQVRLGRALQALQGRQQELLRCAIEHELQAIDELGSVMEMLPLGDLRAEFTLLARWNLGSLERRAALARFVRRGPGEVPGMRAPHGSASAAMRFGGRAHRRPSRRSRRLRPIRRAGSAWTTS
jgi:hypothetical protein